MTQYTAQKLTFPKPACVWWYLIGDKSALEKRASVVSDWRTFLESRWLLRSIRPEHETPTAELLSARRIGSTRRIRLCLLRSIRPEQATKDFATRVSDCRFGWSWVGTMEEGQ
jgi:hypothetical protein